MPELPEVETIRRGLAPHLEERTITAVEVRQPRLRQPVPDDLAGMLTGATIATVSRRGKYLLVSTDRGTLILHLGMTGTLRLLPGMVTPGPHDHLDITLDSGAVVRFRDPRRFGLVLFTTNDPLRHPLLRSLGPEPLEAGFLGHYLHRQAKGRRVAIKPFLMDGHVVVGVGNIYAAEALHRAGIAPIRQARRVSLRRFEVLAEKVREVLGEAITAGGTTISDFRSADGEPGWFTRELRVYGRKGAACTTCATPIRSRVLGQRSTYWCPRCQT